MATMQVEVVSPERVLYSGTATMVLCRTAGGDIAFLPGHAPYLGVLGIGKIQIRTEESGDILAAVHGGFVEVSENKVTILSDVAELASQIDVDRARVALERQEKAEDPDAKAMARARVRLEVAGAPLVSAH